MIKKEPYHLLNFLKLISLGSIILLHTNEFIFYQDVNPILEQARFYFWIEYFSRFIPFSGQSIVFCIFFIWGLKQKVFKNFLAFAFVLIFIHLLMAIPFWGEETYLETLEWDIYPYILFSYLIIQGVKKASIPTTPVIIGSMFFLLVPTYFFTGLPLPELVKGPLVGNCSEGLAGAWPLIPWSALPVLAYFLATLLKDKKELFSFEKYLWPLLLGLGATQIGAYRTVPVGPSFYCYVLNQSPISFWGNFIFIIFIARVSLLDQVQSFLSQFKLCRFISGLAWSRRLGFCYILQLFILIAASQFKEIFHKPFYFDLLLVSLFPAVELLVRSFEKYFLRQITPSIK